MHAAIQPNLHMTMQAGKSKLQMLITLTQLRSLLMMMNCTIISALMVRTSLKGSNSQMKPTGHFINTSTLVGNLLREEKFVDGGSGGIDPVFDENPYDPGHNLSGAGFPF